MKDELYKIRKLVGEITKDQLRYVDSFVAENIGLFMPVGGPCYYALTPLHSHPSYMFALPFNDQTSIKIDGKIITPMYGKIFAMSPNILHHELSSDSPPRYIVILIDKEFLEGQICQYPVTQAAIFRGESYDMAQDLLSLLKKFMIEADNKMAGSETVLNALSLEICHSIIRSIFNFVHKNDRISSRMEIDRVIEYLHSHLGEKITVEEMARIANMSSSHFSRVFKKEIRKTPIDYLSQIRIERAKKFLMAGDKSITEIALECGFNSSAYLSACFYKRYKISPSEYQKGLKKGSISKKDNRILKD
ncbi:MAG: helix-turn-helix transcriptional regulator [Nitrospirae bacterium]|nr:helix-turn-helix transcriptional regulator [Nitrospirota bacterium]